MKEIVPRESHSRVRVEIIRAIMVSGSCLESRFRTRGTITRRHVNVKVNGEKMIERVSSQWNQISKYRVQFA